MATGNQAGCDRREVWPPRRPVADAPGGRGVVTARFDGDRTPRVIAVHCGCDNHNRCAGCGERLAAHRLSAYAWDEARSHVAYLAAYAGLSHRCRG
jgi:hypothetical protein